MSNTTSNWTKPIIYTPPHMSNDTAELFDALERANKLLSELTFSEWIPKVDAASIDIRQRINAAHVIASSALKRAEGDALYTEAQLKQYGDDRAREALEMAAKVGDKFKQPSQTKTTRVLAALISHDIRTLAKEIK